MKKALSLILVLVAIMGLCACGMPEGIGFTFPPEYNTQPTTSPAVETKPQIKTEPTTETQAPTVPESEAVLSPESAVQIYLDAVDNWILEDKMYMSGYRYLFLDLNFDGVLELITSSCDGSGKYSSNHYYTINLSDYSVEPIKDILQSEDYYGQVDFMISGYPKLYYDNENSEKMYVLADMTGVSDMYGFAEYKITCENNTVNSELLFTKYEAYDYVDEPSEPSTYHIHIYGRSEQVEAKLYHDEYNKYYRGLTDLNLVYGFVVGNTFGTATASERKQLLLDAYEAYSYDGFNFDSVETLDADVEPDTTTAPPVGNTSKDKIYIIADYKDMTINEMADIWGNDYIVSESWLSGSWKGVYFEDRRTPLIFYYNDPDLDGVCTGKEEIVGIECFADDENLYTTVDNMSIHIDYDTISTYQPQGKYYQNMMEGSYNFSFKVDESSYIYVWSDSPTGDSDYVRIVF